MRTTTHAPPPLLASAAARRHRRSSGTATWSEADGRRRDDWALAFAVRLASLGARDGVAELARLGRALYEHYDLLDPYHIARMVWQRRAKDGAIVMRRTP